MGPLLLAAIVVRRREGRSFAGDKGIATASYTAGLTVTEWIGVEQVIGNLSMADYRRMASVLDPEKPDAVAARLQRLGGYNV